MDIQHSRRILILGSREAGALDVVKDLTGSAPQPDINGSTAGLTHEWNAQTAYYNAKVPIWIDEVTDIESWKTEFLKDEAAEVVEAVGAWIFCSNKTQNGKISDDAEEAMKSIEEVIQQHAPGSDAVLLAVAKKSSKETQEGSKEDAEDMCMQYGFEYIDYTATGKNEFGEKQGFERLQEALEANEWADAAGEDDFDLDDLDLGDLDDQDFDTSNREEAEMTAELFGMKAALNTEDGEPAFEPEAEDFMGPAQQAGQVEDLDKMLGKLLAIKEQSAGLPEQQRKRMAAQAVRNIMKDNPAV